MNVRRWFLTLACAALFAAPPTLARKKEPLPPPTTGLIDNVNGLAISTDGRLDRFTGLLISLDGKVERRLSAGEKRPERLAYRMDAKGRTLIPSFVDGHAHVIDTGIRLMTLDLSEAGSLAEAQAKITAYAQANPGRKWIFGSGWDAERWAMATNPTTVQLDAAVSDTPAWLISANGRLGWANSAALRLAGMKAEAALSGVNKLKMERFVPSPAPKDRDIALDKAQQHYLAQGYSTVADMGTDILDWQAFRRAGDRGALRLRIIGYADGIDNMITIAGSAPSQWLYDDRLRLIGVHLPVERGSDATRLRNQASRAAMDGFQLALNPDGPADRSEALGTIAEMQQTYAGDRRWRIEEPAAAPETPFAKLARLSARAGGLAAALEEMTGGAARNMFAENIVGRLQPGQQADFLIVDRDISVTAADISATMIVEHWVGGRRVWTAN